jgi:hypothetical protein
VSLFLPAMMPRLFTLAFVTSAESSASTITLPSAPDCAVGDLAVLLDRALGTGSPASVTPSGWSSANSTTATDRRQNISYKVLESGDIGASITGMNGGTNRKLVFIFRASIPLVSALNSTFNGEGTDGNPASQGVAASGGAVPLVVIGAIGASGSGSAFSTASPAFDATVAHTSNAMVMGYKIYNSGPADHTIDANDIADGNILQSGYIGVT